MKFLAAIFVVLILSVSGVPQDGCDYDERCGSNMCLVWENGRQVCNPKQYKIAVLSTDCVEKVEKTPNTRIEAPLDYQGNPDASHVVIIAPKLTLKSGCDYRIETRSH
jgi:hypothetical protein